MAIQAAQELRDPRANEAPPDPRVFQDGKDEKAFVANLVRRVKSVLRATKDAKVLLGKQVNLGRKDQEVQLVNQGLVGLQAAKDLMDSQEPQDQRAVKANQDFRAKRALQELQEWLVHQESKDLVERKDLRVLKGHQANQALMVNRDPVDRMDHLVLMDLMERWDLVVSVEDLGLTGRLVGSVPLAHRVRLPSAMADMEVATSTTDMARRLNIRHRCTLKRRSTEMLNVEPEIYGPGMHEYQMAPTFRMNYGTSVNRIKRIITAKYSRL